MILCVFLAVAVIASANVFVYFPVTVSPSPVPPPLILLDPNVTGVVAGIGPNQTSASVVTLASNIVDLVKNPDFYSSADQWYAQAGTYLSVYWAVDSVGGSSGGTVEFRGVLPWFTITEDSAYVLQPVRTPAATILSATMTVRFRLARLPALALAYYVFGVWDPAGTGGWAWVTVGSLSTSAGYTTRTFTVTNISSDRDYYVVGGIVVYTSWVGGTVDYYIDYIQLSLETAEYAFSNSVLDLNVTAGGPYYAWLTVTGIDAQPDLDCNITLINLTSYRSSPITVSNGVLVTANTSEVLLPQPSSALYVSGSIEVSLVKGSAINSTINLTLTYCSLPGGEGVCVSYPITLVLDPPGMGTTYNAERNEVDSAPMALSRKALRIDLDEAGQLLKGGGG